MLLDDLAQLWGHAAGLPGLRVGMGPSEARAAVGGTLFNGNLGFTVGDPGPKGPPAMLFCKVMAWREITLYTDANDDLDERFWGGATLIAEYVAAEMGARKPRYGVGVRGQPLLRMHHRGVADGVRADLRFSADGRTEEGLSMWLSILPERPWSDVVGDALGVGSALSALLDPAAPEIPAGGTVSLPAELDGGRVEVLRAVDGALRVRVLEARSSGHEKAGARSAAGHARELLERLCPKKQQSAAAGALVYAGLQGASGSFEVRCLEEPAQAVAELSIRAAP
jgi:hypothetical protein